LASKTLLKQLRQLRLSKIGAVAAKRLSGYGEHKLLKIFPFAQEPAEKMG
jgi:hypothetical protein